MIQYLIRRLLQMVMLMFFISVLVFGILNLIPGGPFDALLADPRVTANEVRRLEELIGLNKPVHERYLTRVSKAIRLDWGESWQVGFGRPVSDLIRDRLPHTLKLMGLSIALSALIALPIGVYSALKRYSWADYLVTAISFLGISMPVFWFAIMLMIIFAVNLRWLPTGGVSTPGFENDVGDQIKHLVLPTVVLSLVNIAQWSRFMRSSMLEVLSQDYLRTARAKGLAESLVVLRHGVRNALLPVITILGIEIPVLFSGAVITESIFSWPGMGRLLVQSVFANDWPVAQAVIMITAFLVIFGNLIADVLYAVADPRIRYT